MFFIKRWLRTIMGFSKAQSYGFVILLPLVAIIVFSEPLSKWIVSNRSDDFSKENDLLDSLVQANFKVVNKPLLSTEEPRKTKVVSAFDPNSASPALLGRLGFSKKIAGKIIKYRSLKGKFRIKSDLMKIYGMDSALYQNLYAFILLPEKADKNNQIRINSQENTFKTKKIVEKFDLNKADTIQLKTIYGIGSILANRIVKYRLRLGGFVNVNQLKEVYGLDSVAINKLVRVSFLKSDFDVARIDINTSTEKELKTHPYITYSIAKAIVTYRFQHGNFITVEDIRKVFAVKGEVADKLIPYLKI